MEIVCQDSEMSISDIHKQLLSLSYRGVGFSGIYNNNDNNFIYIAPQSALESSGPREGHTGSDDEVKMFNKWHRQNNEKIN